MIDFANVIVEGGNAQVLGYPRTARLTHFGITPNDMQIRTEGTAGWPEVGEPRNGRDGQAGTLWLFLNVNGRWVAAGAERLRKYQLNGGKPVADPNQGGLGTLVGGGWLYDSGRWPTLAGHNPKPGDLVGVMVVAGSTRSDSNVIEQARTQVVVVEWPSLAGAQPMRVVWQEGDTVPEAPVEQPQPAPEPIPQPQEPTIPAPPVVPSVELAPLLAQLTRIADGVDRLAKAWGA
jgi:hypothetical protein